MDGETKTATAPDFEALLGQLQSRLTADETLPAERRLAEELGVKRHQLRRALRQLEESGAYVRPVAKRAEPARNAAPARRRAGFPAMRGLAESTNPIEVIEMRLAIEPALARLAAVRGTPAEIEQIRIGLEPRFHDDDMRAADVAFHRAISEAAHNALGAALLAQLAALDGDHRLRVTLPERTLAIERAEHGAIMQAIADHDPIAAEQAMINHLHSVEHWLLRRKTT